MVFRNQSVRDLAWVINSPSLIKLDNNFSFDSSKDVSWLDSLDDNPEELLSYLAQRKRNTLGDYFETLVGFYFEKTEGIEILGRNIQVIEGKDTIGEYDFIIKEGNIFKHIEVAVKFYIAVEDSGNWNNFIGPMTKDRLDIKLDKLINRQTHLSETPRGRKILDEMGVGEVASEILLKGCFFYQYDRKKPIIADSACEDHLRGQWCKIGDIDNVITDGNWTILEKPFWLSAPCYESSSGFKADEFKAVIREEIVKNRRPLLVAKIGEELKVFVVPDNWPGGF